MNKYDQVYATMSKQQLWEHIVAVARQNEVEVGMEWHGSGDSGELSDYWVKGPKADSNVECIKSKFKYEWSEEEQRTKTVISSEQNICSLADYIIDMGERLGEMADVDWYNNDGGRLYMYISADSATWEEYFIVSSEELGSSLSNPTSKK